jgi:hypothetical protein
MHIFLADQRAWEGKTAAEGPKKKFFRAQLVKKNFFWLKQVSCHFGSVILAV